MNISVTADGDDLRRAFDKAPVLFTTKLQGWVSRSALRAERQSKLELRSKTSPGASGRTLNSIATKIGYLEATVKPATDYAYYTHEGRKPGRMPPFQEGSDLANWARRVGISPFLVARSIARKGTKGIPYLETAYRSIKSDVERDGDKTVDDMLRSL